MKHGMCIKFGEHLGKPICSPFIWSDSSVISSMINQSCLHELGAHAAYD